MGPVSSAELHAGLVTGGAAALVIATASVVRHRLRPTSAVRPPWANGGLALVAAGLGALALVGALPWEVVAGVVGVTAAVDLAAVAGRSTLVRAAAALPFATFVATADVLPERLWFQALVVVAIAGGGALAASTDATWADEAAAPVLLAIAVAGIYSAVPDTEAILGLLGVALWGAVLAWPWPIARLGPGGAAGMVALVVWAAAQGTVGRPASLIGAVACAALLVLVPIGMRVGAQLPGLLDDVGPRLRVVALGVVQVAVVLFTARTAGLQSSALAAAALAVPGTGVALAAAAVLRPPPGPDPAERAPITPLRSTPPTPPSPPAR